MFGLLLPDLRHALFPDTPALKHMMKAVSEIGILMLLSLVWMSFTGKLTTRDSMTVELVGLYWHFVDIVWIVIFTLVYLIPA